jgi:hypothetical protein
MALQQWVGLLSERGIRVARYHHFSANYITRILAARKPLLERGDLL